MDPGDTPYDLRWRMLGTDVRVSPWFWLMSVILGWSAIKLGFIYLVLWVVCVFVSILVHEFGHVMMGRIFGTDGHIVLYSFGGLAVGSSNLEDRWQRILVYLAGPGAGFLLYFLVLGCELLGFVPTPEPDIPLPPLWVAVLFLKDINLFWGLLNLAPVYPLDGGQVSRDVCTHISPSNGLRTSLGISVGVAGILAINSLTASFGRPIIPFLNLGGTYMALLFGMLALSSYQLMQQVPRAERWDDDRQPWERDRDPYDQDRGRW